MLNAILAVGLLAIPLQPESVVVDALKRFDGGESITTVGPIPLAGFNFWRRISLGEDRSAVVVSTLWDSGIFFFGPHGNPLNVLQTAEVLRYWVVDLDRDGTQELVTEERVLRGTELLESEFRLYSVTDRGRLLWNAESTAYAGAWWKGFPYDRRSYLRIFAKEDQPYLQYRYPCGGRECIKRLAVARGKLFEQ